MVRVNGSFVKPRDRRKSSIFIAIGAVRAIAASAIFVPPGASPTIPCGKTGNSSDYHRPNENHMSLAHLHPCTGAACKLFKKCLRSEILPARFRLFISYN
jgi:hypothetical protein